MMVMSMVFRSIAALSRQFVSAMTPAALIMVGLIVYTGFAIPVTKMRGWSRWINYINPIAYGFEALMINEFHDRDYACSQFVPTGPGYNPGGINSVCGVVGAQPGQNFVNGDIYLAISYQYYHAHKWRNVGILFGFMIFFAFVYLLATEWISAQKSKGEILVYPRGQIPAALLAEGDSESQNSNTTRPGQSGSKADTTIIQRQTAVFSWKDVVYDIKIKKEERRILDHVDGWVKPGTLTALMVGRQL